MALALSINKAEIFEFDLTEEDKQNPDGQSSIIDIIMEKGIGIIVKICSAEDLEISCSRMDYLLTWGEYYKEIFAESPEYYKCLLSFISEILSEINGIIAEAPWISECPQKPMGCAIKTFLKTLDLDHRF